MGIVEKIIAILFLVPSSMLQTVSALSAQNIGAGKHGRARLTLRYASIMAVIWGTGVCILMQFDAEPFVSLFAKDSAEVVRLGSQYMRFSMVIPASTMICHFLALAGIYGQ